MKLGSHDFYQCYRLIINNIHDRDQILCVFFLLQIYKFQCVVARHASCLTLRHLDSSVSLFPCVCACVRVCNEGEGLRMRERCAPLRASHSAEQHQQRPACCDASPAACSPSDVRRTQTRSTAHLCLSLAN